MATQGSSESRTIYLALADVPALGVIYTNVVVNFKKQGQSTFTTKVLVSADWVELGGGLYSITFSPTDNDTLGDFTYTLAGPDFDNFLYDSYSVMAATPGASPTPPPTQCIVSGNIANQSALAPQHIKIVARPAAFPAKYGSTILAADAVWTYADALGNFSLALVRKSVVMLSIERTGIRSVQITVPDSPTASLVDLLPPFENDYSL